MTSPSLSLSLSLTHTHTHTHSLPLSPSPPLPSPSIPVSPFLSRLRVTWRVKVPPCISGRAIPHNFHEQTFILSPYVINTAGQDYVIDRMHIYLGGGSVGTAGATSQEIYGCVYVNPSWCILYSPFIQPCIKPYLHLCTPTSMYTCYTCICTPYTHLTHNTPLITLYTPLHGV